MNTDKIELGVKHSQEKESQELLRQAFERSTIAPDEFFQNIHLFLNRQSLSRILFLNEIYTKIINVPGSIVQCGVRWGGDLALLSSLRALYEPYNYSRRIIGFDTFSGLKGVTEYDQPKADGGLKVTEGQYAVTEGHVQTLDMLLTANELASPLNHIRKYQLIEGDVQETVPKFLQEQQGEQIALLYLDMDIYEPTKIALDEFVDRLDTGSIIVFDEYLHRQFPGEAKAYRELREKLKIVMTRSQFSTVTAYGIVKS